MPKIVLLVGMKIIFVTHSSAHLDIVMTAYSVHFSHYVFLVFFPEFFYSEIDYLSCCLKLTEFVVHNALQRSTFFGLENLFCSSVTYKSFEDETHALCT